MRRHSGEAGLDIADNIPRYDETHQLETLLDGEPVARFTFAGEPDPTPDRTGFRGELAAVVDGLVEIG